MLRERVLYVVLLFAAILVASSSVLTPLAPGAQQKIVIDFGLAAIDALAILVILLSGSSLVRREMDRRSLDVLLTKPMTRLEYLFGKCLGLVATLVVLTGVMTGILVISVEAAGFGWRAHYLYAILGTALEMMVIASVAVLFSTFTSPTLASLFTLALFVAGNLSDGVLRMIAMGGGNRFLEGLSLAVPSLGLFNLRGDVVHGLHVPAERLVVASVYALVYSITALYVAALIFRRRDFR
jgi:ABC-type transport system involved in multi-copper enzyme maturation permease subunit